jgi:hypothetical protein
MRAAEVIPLEQAPLWCAFRQTSGETYWAARQMGCLIYASHEESLTFTGA